MRPAVWCHAAESPPLALDISVARLPTFSVIGQRCDLAAAPWRRALVALCAVGCEGLFDDEPRLPAVPWPPPSADVRVEPRPEGRFSVAREVFSAENRRRVISVALGDCDGDGLLDALTFGPQADLSVYLGRGGGRFELATVQVAQISGRAGTLVDLDGDGRDDLVAASEAVVALPNLGGCRFGPPRQLAPAAKDFALQMLATDANLDGLTDFSIVPRQAARAPQRLLLARGDGTFDDRSPPPTPYDPSRRLGPHYFPFGVYYDDVDGDGAQDTFALVDQWQSWFSWGARDGGARRDETVTAVLARVDPMSLSPLDFDRDGRVDWFVSGVLSRSLLLWHFGGRDLREAAARAGVDGAGGDFAWGSYSFDADLDGWADVLVRRVGVDPPHPQAPAPGPTELFLNRHDGTFAAAGDAVLDLSARGKTLSCGPSSPRGEVVCFAFEPDAGPVLLVNGLRPRGRQGLLRLRGTVSSPDATGARVSVEGSVRPQLWVYGGQCPYGAEHARVLQLPLGASEAARVTIRWPSGVVQRGVEVRADAVTTASEPAVLTVSPRVLPADGRATAEVVVDPRAAGASRVALALEGPAVWAGEARTDAAGRLHRTLRAPATPGEARVSVSLDGTALRVRPRVIFAATR